MERDIWLFCLAGGPPGELVYDISTVNLLQELVHISLTDDPLLSQASSFADLLTFSSSEVTKRPSGVSRSGTRLSGQDLDQQRRLPKMPTSANVAS